MNDLTCSTSNLIETSDYNKKIFSDPLPHEKIKNSIQVPPSKEIQEIFALFKLIAENPETELIGRIRWLIKKDYDLENVINLREEPQKAAASQRCLYTVQALYAAIFGVKGDVRVYQRDFSRYEGTLEELNRFWLSVKNNENQLKDKPSHFFAYQIDCGQDHVFMLIQYRDEQSNVKYRILQSWMNEHSLNDYMTNRDSFDSEEFMDFTNKLNHVLLHETWTSEKQAFYEQYFMTDNNNPGIGEDHISTWLTFRWGASNLDQVRMQKAEFETFKVHNKLHTGI